MRRRILLTLVGLTAVAVTALFVPAAIATRSRFLADQEVELQRDAAIAASTLPVEGTASAALDSDDEHRFGLYDRTGALVAGAGPPQAEPEVLAALEGDPTIASIGDDLAAGLLIRTTDHGGPYVLRASESRDEARRATQRSIAGLGSIALTVVAAAFGAAWLLSSRLARPVEALRTAAGRLDEGDLAVEASRSGITEIDEVAETLARTGERVRRSLERERAFSADASHQLRTPLAAIRSAIEAEEVDPRPAPSPIFAEVLEQVDHLETTVVGLLELARDTHRERHPVDLAAMAERAASRWAPTFAERRRTLLLDLGDGAGRPRAAEAALAQALDVLLDNALRHGTGSVRLAIAGVAGGVAVTVTDEGSTDLAPNTAFERRPAAATHGNSGIGLPLARTLVEAEGGRLRLVRNDPTTFQITFPID